MSNSVITNQQTTAERDRCGKTNIQPTYSQHTANIQPTYSKVRFCLSGSKPNLLEINISLIRKQISDTDFNVISLWSKLTEISQMFEKVLYSMKPQRSPVMTPGKIWKNIFELIDACYQSKYSLLLLVLR